LEFGFLIFIFEKYRQGAYISHNYKHKRTMNTNIQNSLDELVKVEEKFANSINEKKLLLFSLENNEVYQISLSIVEKLISTQKLISSNNLSLIENYASLRYILETLIQTELLLIEPKYTYILFYSIHHHQIDKTNRFIERIKKEILIMEKYELEDRKTITILLDGREKAEKELDDKADLEYTMFCGNFKYWGYGYTKSLLETKILPEYQKRLKLLEDGKTDIAKKLLKNTTVVGLFQFNNQHTKVFTELKDTRSWKEKAKTVQLDSEYELVYELSSAVLHSTSYSYFTSKEIDENEIEMIKKLCFQYSKKIMLNLNTYTKLELFELFKVIEIK
jgi:hypothetical protein